MTTATLSPAPPPGRPQRRFTVAEYHKLGDLGILTPADRVELIHGLIVEKPVINPPHTTAVNKLTRLLLTVAARACSVRMQQPITLADSEPEPDGVLAVGTDDDYAARHPRPRDVALVVEVADSSLPDDRGTKLRLYAAAKLPVYWIVNLIDRRVEVYTDPRGGKNPGYKTVAEYGPGAAVPVVVGGADLGAVAVADLLP